MSGEILRDNNIGGYRLIHVAIFLNVMAGINTLLFWVGFFTEFIFPKDTLKPLINNFDGYYAWERCFVVPDTLTACVAIFASVLLFKKQNSIFGGVLLSAVAGAWIFLGVLDFTYAITNGMYSLGHWFSYILLSIGVGLPFVGFVTLYSLYAERKETEI